MYRVLAIAYINQDDLDAALDAAETAMVIAPADQQPLIQQLIEQISEAQLLPDTAPSLVVP